MNKTFIVTGLVAALAGGAYFVATRESTHEPIAPEQRQALPAAIDQRVAGDVHREASIDVRVGSAAMPTTTEFGLQVMSNGELIIDSATRSVVEELSAVADVSELYEVEEHLERTLPRAAGERAADLVERYYRYRIALDERLHYEEMAAVPQDATIALDALKALRTEFFGAELTALWFGKEDAIGREMIAQAERFP
jgi:hypothetical protein